MQILTSIKWLIKPPSPPLPKKKQTNKQTNKNKTKQNKKNQKIPK